ncbi:MAG: molybdenum cofactor guanylyltransferase [bacterium]
MTEKTGITGIVLSGGKSSRMGEEKGLAVFNGRPLIKYAIEILENVCDEVLISANQQAAIPVYQGYPEPLCGIYATNTLWYMNDLISKRQYKMMDLLDAIYCVKVEINHTLPFFMEDMFLNINTGKDLKTAETGRNKR